MKTITVELSDKLSNCLLELVESLANKTLLLDFAANGIVVDEELAKATPCTCIEYRPGRYICWSKGVVGALSDVQEELYCNPRIVKEGRIPARIEAFLEASDICLGLPLKERIECMSRELAKRGIKL